MVLILHHHRSLVAVEMQNNDVGKDGGEALLAALKDHTSIAKFCDIPIRALAQNNISELGE